MRVNSMASHNKGHEHFMRSFVGVCVCAWEWNGQIISPSPALLLLYENLSLLSDSPKPRAVVGNISREM